MLPHDGGAFRRPTFQAPAVAGTQQRRADDASPRDPVANAHRGRATEHRTARQANSRADRLVPVKRARTAALTHGFRVKSLQRVGVSVIQTSPSTSKLPDSSAPSWCKLQLSTSRTKWSASMRLAMRQQFSNDELSNPRHSHTAHSRLRRTVKRSRSRPISL